MTALRRCLHCPLHPPGHPVASLPPPAPPPMPFLRLLRLITAPQSILLAASPFFPMLGMLPAFNTSSNTNKLLSLSELWLKSVFSGLFLFAFPPRSSCFSHQREVCSSRPSLLPAAQVPRILAPGHKEKGFVSLSTDIIYSCHPHFKAEGPPLGALVLGQGPSDLGPGGAGGEQAGEGSRGVTGWPVSLGGQCCLALAGADLIGLLSGPCGLL